jgi:hypothetical protein
MEASLDGLTLLVADVELSKQFYLRIPGTVLIHQRPGEFALIQMGQGDCSFYPPKNRSAGKHEVDSHQWPEPCCFLKRCAIESGVPVELGSADRCSDRLIEYQVVRTKTSRSSLGGDWRDHPARGNDGRRHRS